MLLPLHYYYILPYTTSQLVSAIIYRYAKVAIWSVGIVWQILLLFVMSLKGIVELAVWLESYYIIEYPQQGLFSFSLRLYQGPKKRVLFLSI